MLIYVSQLFARIFDKCGDLIQNEILQIRDPNGLVIFYQQITTLLTIYLLLTF